MTVTPAVISSTPHVECESVEQCVKTDQAFLQRQTVYGLTFRLKTVASVRNFGCILDNVTSIALTLLISQMFGLMLHLFYWMNDRRAGIL